VTAYRNILVRAPNWMGDAVMAIPTLSALRARFPAARVTLLAKPPVAALFEQHPDVDQIIVYERPGRHAGGVGLWRLIQLLRTKQFDLALLLQNAFEAAFIAAVAGIPTRVGYTTDGRRFLLTKSLKPDTHTGTHQVTRYLALLQRLEGVAGSIQEGMPYLVVTAGEHGDAGDLLESEGVAPGERLIGFHAGAAYGSAKRWPPDRFAAVADALVARFQIRPLLFGSAEDVSVVDKMRSGMKYPAIMLAGKTTVRQMMALIARCQMVVTNDSGPMHVAAALGRPVLAIFGPTHPEATSPKGALSRIVYNKVACAPCAHRICPIDHRCMAGISVEEVVESAGRLLESSGSLHGESKKC